MVESPLLGSLTQILKDEPRCRGLFLAGSYATGTADTFSDTDLVGIAEPADQTALVTVWRAGLEKIAPIVLFRSFSHQQSCLTNAVTADWDRIDLYLQSPVLFGQRAAGSVLAVRDPDNRLATLQAVDRPDPRPKVSYLAEEFLRVLGLLHVAAGRGDYVTAATGAGLLRDHLIALLRFEAGVEQEGALHLSRSLSPQDMAMLYALRVPRPERASVLSAHLALAGAFIPRAQAMLASLGLAWPATLEDATRRRLIKSFGTEADIIW